jgi:hypothetical protein
MAQKKGHDYPKAFVKGGLVGVAGEALSSGSMVLVAPNKYNITLRPLSPLLEKLAAGIRIDSDQTVISDEYNL